MRDGQVKDTLHGAHRENVKIKKAQLLEPFSFDVYL
jgi:hypothetical protein